MLKAILLSTLFESDRQKGLGFPTAAETSSVGEQLPHSSADQLVSQLPGTTHALVNSSFYLINSFENVQDDNFRSAEQCTACCRRLNTKIVSFLAIGTLDNALRL